MLTTTVYTLYTFQLVLQNVILPLFFRKDTIRLSKQLLQERAGETA